MSTASAEQLFAETVTELRLGKGWRNIVRADYDGGYHDIPLVAGSLLLLRLRDGIMRRDATSCAHAVRVIDALQQQLGL